MFYNSYNEYEKVNTNYSEKSFTEIIEYFLTYYLFHIYVGYTLNVKIF